MLFVEYPKCSTCKKAKQWLDDHGLAYEDRHIVEDNPTAEELKQWHAMSGMPLKKFFQHQRYAVPGAEPEGASAPDDGGGAV